ncbi:MAG: biotin--[acetyl-CoA-carboxylase] ligase [Thiobacillus sp.]|nr:biotin--[acetyl-CoA-carboxylase] ligase [Thiobacillus sp.]
MTTPTHKVLFPILRRLSDGRFHSGQDLAREFRLSRASVFNVIRQAQAMGLDVYAVRGRGYQTPRPVDWLDETSIRACLGEAATAFDVRVVDSVSSTNTALMQAGLQGATSGSVICAEHQLAGKGRRGRRWHAVLGGSLTFSVLWRFENGLQSLAGLSLAAGLAVARALNRLGPHQTRLKWPNDVLMDYRKLAGILVEVQGDLDGAAFAVVGIGLNVSLSPAQRDAVDQAVVDLREMGVTVARNQLLADCLRELHAVLTVFRQHGFDGLSEDWMALDAYDGKAVSLKLPDRQDIEGVAAGVDTTGALLLRNAKGDVQAYSGGEISLRLKRGKR